MVDTRNMTISCGMYSFTQPMQQAWAEIFGQIHQYLPSPFNSPFKFWYDDDTNILGQADLFIGQTCGYPFIKKWHETHIPVCVARFSIDGCEGTNYSSWFVTRSDSTKTSTAEFKNSTAVINNTDSNSGMNVLRYEISKLANGEPFFNRVLVSNSHLESMKKVASGEADLAAIDAVTYKFAIEQNIIDKDALKVIGQSELTAGLPFIISKSRDIDAATVRDAINTSYENISEENRNFMSVISFDAADPSDYDYTLELELKAAQNGYPQLA